MAIALDVARIHRFITEADRKLPPEQQTTFLIGVISARDQAELEDLLWDSSIGPDGASITRTRIRQQAFKYGVLAKGLKGWENFRGADCLEVKFVPNGNGASDESLSLIDAKTRTAISNAIVGLSRVGEDDEKN